MHGQRPVLGGKIGKLDGLFAERIRVSFHRSEHFAASNRRQRDRIAVDAHDRNLLCQGCLFHGEAPRIEGGCGHKRERIGERDDAGRGCGEIIYGSLDHRARSCVPDAARMGIVDAGIAGEGSLDAREAAAAVVGQTGLAEAAYDQNVAIPPKMSGEVVGGKPGDVVQAERRDGQGMRNGRFAQVDNGQAGLEDGQRQLFGPTPVDHGMQFEGEKFLDDGKLGSRSLGIARHARVNRDKLDSQAPGSLVDGVFYLQPEGIVAGVTEADNQVTGHACRIGPNVRSVNWGGPRPTGLQSARDVRWLGAAG